MATQPPEGTVVFTPAQTAGRGQQNNVWVSDPHQNLTFSVILYPRRIPVDRLFTLNKLASLALQSTLQTFLPTAEIQVKWPNDILVNRKKIAGILIENQLDGRGLRASIIGIGLNVNQTAFPPEFAHRTTSLQLESGQQNIPQEVLQHFCKNLEVLYQPLLRGNSDLLDRAYLQHLFGYQEDIEVILDGEQQTVHLVGVDKMGRLAIAQEQRLRYLQMKEIAFVL